MVIKEDAKRFVDLLMDPNCDFKAVIGAIPQYMYGWQMEKFRSDAIDCLALEN